MTSTFESELRARLDARMSEIDDEQRRIGAALAALSPKPPQQGPAADRAPRGRNREAIVRALRRRSMRAAELRRATGIRPNVLATTLSTMRKGGYVVNRNGRWGLA